MKIKYIKTTSLVYPDQFLYQSTQNCLKRCFVPEGGV